MPNEYNGYQDRNNRAPSYEGGNSRQAAPPPQPLTGADLIADEETVLRVMVARNDVAILTTEQRHIWYLMQCKQADLDPKTMPFIYVVLSGKLSLYATKKAAEMLCQKHKISTHIGDQREVKSVFIYKCTAKTPDGRSTDASGAVSTNDKYGKELSGENLANAIMKAECVPLDSEILTRRGFVRFDGLTIGEDVLAYDAETDTTVWTPLQDVTVHGNLPMARLYTDKGQFAALCTPDHSWAVAKQPFISRGNGARKSRGAYSNRQPERFLTEAQNIKTSHRLILAAPQIETEPSLLTPDEAAILGWSVTDGTIQFKNGKVNRIGICQSKTRYIPVIRELTRRFDSLSYESIGKAGERTFPKSGKTYTTLPQTWCYITAQKSRDLLQKAGFWSRNDLPSIVTRLSFEARAAMLEAMMMAEGDSRHIFAQKDERVLEAFQILCTLQGIAVGKATLRKDGDCYTQNKKLTRHVAGNFLNLEMIGESPAWCPTTRFGTWVMRQGGRVMVTGNTKSRRRAVLAHCGLGMLDETELDTIAGAVKMASFELLEEYRKVRKEAMELGFKTGKGNDPKVCDELCTEVDVADRTAALRKWVVNKNSESRQEATQDSTEKPGDTKSPIDKAQDFNPKLTAFKSKFHHKAELTEFCKEVRKLGLPLSTDEDLVNMADEMAGVVGVVDLVNIELWEMRDLKEATALIASGSLTWGDVDRKVDNEFDAAIAAEDLAQAGDSDDLETEQAEEIQSFNAEIED